MTMTLLSLNHVSIDYGQGPLSVYALTDISFALESGTTLGLVGESGCGKSSLALTILGLLPDSAVVRGGTVELAGTDLLSLRATRRVGASSPMSRKAR
jgi:peptide/nickel transport system ATP-binding protein